MRILIAFIAVCVLMLAILAWHVFTGGVFDAGGAKATVPPIAAGPGSVRPPDSAPANLPNSGSALQSEPPLPHDGSYESPASQANVHWATEPAAEDARQRLVEAARVLSAQPDDPAALRDLAGALVALRRWDEAANAMTRLVELEPDDVSLRFEQATVLIQVRRWIDALAALKVVVARTPDDTRAWFNLALCHQAAGHLAEARAAWDRTLALQPSPAAWARRGEVLLDLHDWPAAAADFERVLEQEPDAADATLNLSLALWKLGQTGTARDRLIHFLEGHPRYVPALNRLAEIAWSDCQSATGDWRTSCAEAAAWCRRSLECDPQQPEIQELLDAATKNVSPDSPPS